ncbi:MAG: Rieske (2Fe-2S) protein [Sphingomonas sp.]|nr:MAG: Rieske (2Fe-2S) protein [Sphingomonas sp.]
MSGAPDKTKIYTQEPIPVAERRRVTSTVVPREGENGEFSQSWFPIALSSEVPVGTIVGRDFLDGRVVVYRGEDGVARVQSAYCPHIGADLAVGKVIENRVQCAFHHWEYDENGMCVKTGPGLPPPRGACLYTFPVRERFGMIFVFNGTEALWELPAMEFPDDELVAQPFKSDLYTCDPWIFASNTPDTQHIAVVHGLKFKAQDPSELVRWEDWGFRMQIDAWHQDNEDLAWEAGIFGSSIFYQQGLTDGWWMGVFAGFSLPRAGTHEVFLSVVVRNVSEEGGKSIQERLDFGHMLLTRTAAEDKPILDSIHHRVGYLTKADTALAKYFRFLAKYPRAHPSRDFIN